MWWQVAEVEWRSVGCWELYLLLASVASTRCVSEFNKNLLFSHIENFEPRFFGWRGAWLTGMTYPTTLCSLTGLPSTYNLTALFHPSSNQLQSSGYPFVYLSLCNLCYNHPPQPPLLPSLLNLFRQLLVVNLHVRCIFTLRIQATFSFSQCRGGGGRVLSHVCVVYTILNDSLRVRVFSLNPKPNPKPERDQRRL